MVEDLLPFVFLFAAMMTLLNLSRKLELVVARATGVSVWRFLAPMAALAILIGTLSTLVLNPVSTAMKREAQRIEAAFGPDQTAVGAAPLWFRQTSVDGASLVGTAHRSPDGTLLTGVRAFVFDREGGFREKVEAAEARYRPGFWRLANATVYTADVPPSTQAEYLLPTDLSRDELNQALLEPSALSVWTLPEMIEAGEHTGFDIDRLRLTLHGLLAKPLFLLAMIAIAGTVSLRLFRYGGIVKLVVTGISAGFLLYVFTKIVHDLGGNGMLSPMVAAWAPPIVALTFGATALLVQEDG